MLASSHFHPPHRPTMSTRSRKRKLDTVQKIFDANIDVATLVFSHVQCVKTRVNLALVSKIWRDAAKTADAYPLRFDFDALRHTHSWTRRPLIIRLLDNDEALSLSYERVVGLLDGASKYAVPSVCDCAAELGSIRLLKWARENKLGTQSPWDWSPWNSGTCSSAAMSGHLPALKYLHENGCPWGWSTCAWAVDYKRWDCLQYAVDNKCPDWEFYARKYAEHLR